MLPKSVEKNMLFFSIRVFFLSIKDTENLQDSMGKEENHIKFLSTVSIRSRTFRHLFATLHVRWLPRIFIRIA